MSPSVLVPKQVCFQLPFKLSETVELPSVVTVCKFYDFITNYLGCVVTKEGKTTELDRHPNPTTNPYLVAVRYGSLAQKSMVRDSL